MNSTIINRSIEEIVTFGQFCKYVLNRFLDDNCNATAAALTYTTLFAIVPAITITFTMVTIMPSFESVMVQVQNFIFDHLVPTRGSSVDEFIMQFSTSASQLSAISLGVLFITVILLFNTIEVTFNRIWNVQAKRPMASKLLLFWALITLGPIMLGGSVAASIAVFNTKYLAFMKGTLTLSILIALVPLFFNLILFTVLFGFVPNCYVSLKHAWIGSMVTAFLMAVVKISLATGLFGSNYNAVYGSFAAFPVFLLWIYSSWFVILFGANLTRCLPRYRSFRTHHYSDLGMSINVLRYLWSYRNIGRTLSEVRWFKGKIESLMDVDIEVWGSVKNKLVEHRYLVETNTGEVALGRDLAQVTIGEFLQVIEPNFLHQQSCSIHLDALPKVVNDDLDALASLPAEVLDQPLSNWCELDKNEN